MLKFRDMISDDRLSLKPFDTINDMIVSHKESQDSMQLVGCTMLPSNADVTIVGVHRYKDSETKCDLVVVVYYMQKQGVYIIRHDLSLDVIITPMAKFIEVLGDSIYVYETDKSAYVLVCYFYNTETRYCYEVDECIEIPVYDSLDDMPKTLKLFRLRGKYVIALVTYTFGNVLNSTVLTHDDMLVTATALLRHYRGIPSQTDIKVYKQIDEIVEALEKVVRDIKELRRR